MEKKNEIPFASVPVSRLAKKQNDVQNVFVTKETILSQVSRRKNFNLGFDFLGFIYRFSDDTVSLLCRLVFCEEMMTWNDMITTAAAPIYAELLRQQGKPHKDITEEDRIALRSIAKEEARRLFYT